MRNALCGSSRAQYGGNFKDSGAKFAAYEHNAKGEQQFACLKLHGSGFFFKGLFLCCGITHRIASVLIGQPLKE